MVLQSVLKSLSGSGSSSSFDLDPDPDSDFDFDGFPRRRFTVRHYCAISLYMKILLIYPYCLEDRINAEDSQVVPMGLYSVAAVLVEQGHDVQVLNWHNLRGQPEAMEAVLADERPALVGLSILHANRLGGIEIARLAKKVDPAVHTVFGGIGASLLWEHFLTHFPEVDFIVTGEGEHGLAALVDGLEKGQACLLYTSPSPRD